MKSTSLFIAISFGLLLLTNASSLGQITTDYYKSDVAKDLKIIYPSKHMPVLHREIGDLQRRMREDRERDESGKAYRFAKALSVSATMSEGQWSVRDSLRIWHLSVKSPRALSLSLIFKTLKLEGGAKLYIYNDDQTIVSGPVTSNLTKKPGKFATDVIEGDVLTIELQEPITQEEKSELQICDVVHGYRGLFEKKHEVKHEREPYVREIGKDSVRTRQEFRATYTDMNNSTNDIIEDAGFGESNSCNLDVVTSNGSTRGWGEQANGVGMILINDNQEWCTGCLINNTR